MNAVLTNSSTAKGSVKEISIFLSFIFNVQLTLLYAVIIGVFNCVSYDFVAWDRKFIKVKRSSC